SEDLAPFLFEPHHVCPVPASHFRLPVGKYAVCENGDLAAGRDKVGNSRFHTRAAGARHWECHLVLCAEDVAQFGLYVGHALEEKWIAHANHWLRHGVIDARIDIGGTGTV